MLLPTLRRQTADSQITMGQGVRMHIAVTIGTFLPILVSCFRLEGILCPGEFRADDVMLEFI